MKKLLITLSVVVLILAGAVVVWQYVLKAAVCRAPQKATLGNMKDLSNAIESYIMTNEFAPRVSTMEEMQKLLEPAYCKILPILDGWGFELHYTHGTGEKKDTYTIGSGGKDGIFEGFDQTGIYVVSKVEDFKRDIILSNMDLVYGPETTYWKTGADKNKKEK